MLCSSILLAKDKNAKIRNNNADKFGFMHFLLNVDGHLIIEAHILYLVGGDFRLFQTSFTTDSLPNATCLITISQVKA